MQARLAQIETGLLVLLLFFLPSLEAPKNVALVLFLLVWVARRFLAGSLRFGLPDVVGIAALGLLAASLVSTLANWPVPNGTKGLVDTLKLSLVFLCIYQGGYGAREHRLFATAITAGVIVGLAGAFAQFWLGYRGTLEFHSAGVVTQSAIYLGIAAVLAFGVAVSPDNRRRLAWTGALIVMLVFLFLMGSRGSMGAVLLALGLSLLLLRSMKLWIGALAVLVAVAAIGLTLPNRFDQVRALTKTEQLVEGKELSQADKERLDNWRIGLAQVRQGGSFWLGMGPRNFGSIEIESLVFEEPLAYEHPKLNHAHNLFLNKLVEEGVLGLFALVFLFGLAAALLAKDWWRGNRDWTWFGALGALTVPVIAGSVNTPFQQEHALLAMVLFAIYFAQRKPAAASAPQPVTSPAVPAASRTW